jgi:hypothetical protein
MNHSGTYVYEPGHGLVKISEAMPRLAASVFVPRGDVPHYDKGAMRHFESKAEKRQWMSQHGLKEGGIVTPGKRWEGHARNRGKISVQAKAAAQQRQAYIASQGGTQGLLDRIQQGKGTFL